MTVNNGYGAQYWFFPIDVDQGASWYYMEGSFELEEVASTVSYNGDDWVLQHPTILSKQSKNPISTGLWQWHEPVFWNGLKKVSGMLVKLVTSVLQLKPSQMIRDPTPTNLLSQGLGLSPSMRTDMFMMHRLISVDMLYSYMWLYCTWHANVYPHIYVYFCMLYW